MKTFSRTRAIPILMTIVLFPVSEVKAALTDIGNGLFTAVPTMSPGFRTD
jgi:hypothetical protein